MPAIKDDRPRGYKWQNLVKREAEKAGWRCHLCNHQIQRWEPVRSPWRLAGDHVIPRSKGGSDLSSNIRPAHNICNAIRNNRDMDELPDVVTFRRIAEMRVEEKSLLGPRKAVVKGEQSQRALMPGEYVGGVDGTRFSPWTGEPLKAGARSFRCLDFADLDDRPFDEKTGARRPGIEWPPRSGNFAIR